MQSSVRLRILAGIRFRYSCQNACWWHVRPQTPEIITCGDGCAFRWNAENEKQTNLIDGIFLCCAAVVVGKKSLIDIPHWPEHYEVLSYHFWPAYRQNRLSVFVPEDRCIPLGEIWQRGAFWFPVRQNDSSLSGAVRFPPHVQHGIKRLSASGKDTSCLRI